MDGDAPPASSPQRGRGISGTLIAAVFGALFLIVVIATFFRTTGNSGGMPGMDMSGDTSASPSSSAMAEQMPGMNMGTASGTAYDMGSMPGAALHTFDTEDAHSLAFDLADPDTLYFGHHGGLLVSHDGGKSWRDSSLRGVDAMQQMLALADPPRHYVAGHDIFAVSVDGGQTWQPQTNNLPSLDLHTFSGSPADPNRLYTIPAGMGLFTSDDGGETWVEASLPSGAQTQPIALAVAPNEPRTVFLARNGEIAISVDAAATWRSLAGPGGLISAIAVAPNEGETLYAATLEGLYLRRPNGAWERLPVEIEAMLVSLAVSPARPERIAMLDQDGNFYRSDDGGRTWAR